MANLGYKIFRILIRPIQQLPLGFHHAMGDVFAWLAEHLVRYRRDVIITNLSRSFPEKKYKDISAIAHDYYVHLGEILAETIWFGSCTFKSNRLIDNNYCQAKGVDELLRVWKDNPHIMLLNSHFGNFETLGGLIRYCQATQTDPIPFGPDDICVVYKQLKNRFWDAFVAENRNKPLHHPCNYIESQKVLRFAVKHKNDPMLYIFDNDQHPYKNASRKSVDSFMNQKTEVMVGGVSLAHKFGFAVMYLSFDRLERGKYEMRITPICDDGRTMSEDEMLSRYYNLLEADIRRTPANYLWSHRRWK